MSKECKRQVASNRESKQRMVWSETGGMVEKRVSLSVKRKETAHRRKRKEPSTTNSLKQHQYGSEQADAHKS